MYNILEQYNYVHVNSRKCMDTDRYQVPYCC